MNPQGITLTEEQRTALRGARESQSITQTALAESLSITQSQLSAMESGKIRPNHPKLVEWAAAVGMEAEVVVRKARKR